MKLTLKDKDFLERLRRLMKSKDLFIELKQDGVKRLMLRQKALEIAKERVELRRKAQKMGQIEVHRRKTGKEWPATVACQK